MNSKVLLQIKLCNGLPQIAEFRSIGIRLINALHNFPQGSAPLPTKEARKQLLTFLCEVLASNISRLRNITDHTWTLAELLPYPLGMRGVHATVLYN